MNYFKFIAEETARADGRLGVTQLTDLIGRTDLLEALPGLTARQAKAGLVRHPGGPAAPAGCQSVQPAAQPTFDKGPLNLKMVEGWRRWKHGGGEFRYDIRNTDRSVGARLSGEIVKRHGNPGHGGRSGQVALQRHRRPELRRLERRWPEMILTGMPTTTWAGMTGGKLVIKPTSAWRSNPTRRPSSATPASMAPPAASSMPQDRWRAVRGAQLRGLAVVEGIGDNGCEYMTGGIVTVLGKTGVNLRRA